MDDYEKELNDNAHRLKLNSKGIGIILKAIDGLGNAKSTHINNEYRSELSLSPILTFTIKAYKHAHLCKLEANEFIKQNKKIEGGYIDENERLKKLMKSFTKARDELHKGLGLFKEVMPADYVPHIARWQEYEHMLSQDLEGIEVSIDTFEWKRKNFTKGLRLAKGWFVSAVNSELKSIGMKPTKGNDETYGTQTPIVRFMDVIYGEPTESEQIKLYNSEIKKNGTIKRIKVNPRGLALFKELNKG